MIKYLNELCYNRSTEIFDELQASNEFYSDSLNGIATIKAKLSDLIAKGEVITLTAEDTHNLHNYFEYVDLLTDLHKKELYKIGFLDCLSILKTIGIL